MVSGKCRNCSKMTDKLVGLFVPHLCQDCLDATRKEEIAKGHVCLLCHKAYCDCYC